MKLDKLVLKRFEELENKADEVSTSKEVDFISIEGKPYYKISSSNFKGWGTSALNLLQRALGEESVHYQNFSNQYDSFSGWETDFEDCRSIFVAAKEDYQGGYLFNIRSLLKAEVLVDALDQAKELLDGNYKDPACILAGVALEITLKELCDRDKIPHNKLDKMNTDLSKAGIYNLARQKQITAWADLRNNAAHGQWSEYNELDVKDLISGVERFIADYL